MVPERSHAAQHPRVGDASTEGLLQDDPTGVHDRSVARRAADVLVVEDDDGNREVLVAILERKGYRVASATQGLEALAYLRLHRPPRVIVLDLVMPEMDGWAFMSVREADATLATIPVVVVSALADAGAAPPPGAASYLAKPIRIRDLLDVIDCFVRVAPGEP